MIPTRESLNPLSMERVSDVPSLMSFSLNQTLTPCSSKASWSSLATVVRSPQAWHKKTSLLSGYFSACLAACSWTGLRVAYSWDERVVIVLVRKDL